MACMFVAVVNTKYAAGISPPEPRGVLAFARSLAPPPDADVGLVRLAGAPRPVSTVKARYPVQRRPEREFETFGSEAMSGALYRSR
jgi:hypothetical protein